MKQTITIHSLGELEQVAEQLMELRNEYSVFAFYGEMGAGKTTFIKEICKVLGIENVVTSPTFSIVNEYEMPSGEAAFHFDFYRLNKAEEAIQIGYYEYVESGQLCFMEWPEKIENLLPSKCVYVSIVADDESGARTISWETKA